MFEGKKWAKRKENTERMKFPHTHRRTYTTQAVRTSGSGHVHGVREVGPVDAGVVGLFFEHLVGLVSWGTGIRGKG
jgi:hypothetical protein